MRVYPPLLIRVTTPRLELAGATDELLERLAPLVAEGKASAFPDPYDDPMSLYEEDDDQRVNKWLQGIWRGRGAVASDFWRLYFVVKVDGEPVGMQDLVASQFPTYGAVDTFSWLSSDVRAQGLGREMREAVLHLAFEGLDAKEAASEAFEDNIGSNRVSEALGYQPNGTTRATRRGQPVRSQRWRLTRSEWEARRRDDIELHGVDQAKPTLGI